MRVPLKSAASVAAILVCCGFGLTPAIAQTTSMADAAPVANPHTVNGLDTLARVQELQANASDEPAVDAAKHTEGSRTNFAPEDLVELFRNLSPEQKDRILAQMTKQDVQGNGMELQVSKTRVHTNHPGAIAEEKVIGKVDMSMRSPLNIGEGVKRVGNGGANIQASVSKPTLHISRVGRSVGSHNPIGTDALNSLGFGNSKSPKSENPKSKEAKEGAGGISPSRVTNPHGGAFVRGGVSTGSVLTSSTSYDQCSFRARAFLGEAGILLVHDGNGINTGAEVGCSLETSDKVHNSLILKMAIAGVAMQRISDVYVATSCLPGGFNAGKAFCPPMVATRQGPATTGQSQ